MTTPLADKTCTPCSGGVPPLEREEPKHFERMPKIGNCSTMTHRIERKFRFENIREALSIVEKVGDLAQAEGHHPKICFGWDHARGSLQTKKIEGLHKNDFIMAVKIDPL